MDTGLSEPQVEFYLNEMLEKANHLFHFAYAISLNRSTAASIVDRTFERGINKITTLTTKPNLLLSLAKLAWSSFDQLEKSIPDPDPFWRLWTHLEPEARACLFSMDTLGFTAEETADLLQKPSSEVYSNLAHARKSLMEFNLQSGVL